MRFCVRCGGLLLPDKSGKKRFVCGSCGAKSEIKDKVLIKEKINNKDEKIGVVEKNVEVNPKTDANCDKCGNKLAFYWTVQTRAGDEAETRFFQCTKCGHRWREYQ